VFSLWSLGAGVGEGGEAAGVEKLRLAKVDAVDIVDIKASALLLWGSLGAGVGEGGEVGGVKRLRVARLDS